jgi:cytochrome c-type biogenesis protein CcmH
MQAMKYHQFILITLILIFGIAQVTAVSAQETIPSSITDDEVNAIAKQLYCPVCENIPLDVCGTQACEQWRELIRDKLAQGWNEDEIKEYFVLQYGDRVLAEPPPRGFNWLVYLVPPVVFLAGVIILYRGIQSWRQMEASEGDRISEPATPIDDYVSRLEEELRKND